MSQGALMQAVRDQLQTTFTAVTGETYDANSIEVCFDARPKPVSGQVFIAVHPGSWQIVDEDWDLHEGYEVSVTITMRIGVAPNDRRGIAIWLSSANPGSLGMEQNIRTAITAIHQNQLVRIAANNYILESPGGEGGGLFATALKAMRVDPPQLRGPEWFFGEPMTDDNFASTELGVSQTITFGKAVRGQDIPDMD